MSRGRGRRKHLPRGVDHVVVLADAACQEHWLPNKALFLHILTVRLFISNKERLDFLMFNGDFLPFLPFTSHSLLIILVPSP